MKKVLCILVLYNPSYDVLADVIGTVVPQVDMVWISDNTPGGYNQIGDFLKKYYGKIKYALMDGNVGIAKAQNVAIKYAIDNDFDFIYFLDQDSISPSDIVGNLIQRFRSLEAEGVNVGGVGPLPYNREAGKPYLPNIKKGHFIKEDIVEVTEIISSASLLKSSLFKYVGMMDEKLFTDNVDHELCWRAADRSGCRFFKVTSLLLSHKLGEGDRRFMGITVKISTPFRTYYQYRNYFYLIKKRYVPFYAKFSMGLKYLGKYFYYPIFCSQRYSYLKNINKGIWDGLVGKM